MAQSIENWTAGFDFRLRRMRLEGASWGAIAQALTVSSEAARARASQIGARWLQAARSPHDDPAREPLAAGDARAWEVLTAGTLLAGTRYPLPSARESVA